MTRLLAIAFVVFAFGSCVDPVNVGKNSGGGSSAGGAAGGVTGGGSAGGLASGGGRSTGDGGSDGGDGGSEDDGGSAGGDGGFEDDGGFGGGDGGFAGGSAGGSAGGNAGGFAISGEPDAGVALTPGTWHLSANGARLTLTLQDLGTSIIGAMGPEGGATAPITSVSWDRSTQWLEFQRLGASSTEWYRVRIESGVLAGRFSVGTSTNKPVSTAYRYFVRGWNANELDVELWPRTWDLTVSNTVGEVYGGVLRIDREPTFALGGWLKMVTKFTMPAEEIETAVSAVSWDGTTLQFTRNFPSGTTQQFAGTSQPGRPRVITGTFTSTSGSGTFEARRSGVAGFGLGARAAPGTAWRSATRARLALLTQGYRLPQAPVPAATVGPATPRTPAADPHDRDDRPLPPAAYTATPVEALTYPLFNEFDAASPAVTRTVRIRRASPLASGVFPLVIVLGGHGSFLENAFEQQNNYEFMADSFARRGYRVLALETTHRFTTPNRFYQACPTSSCGQGTCQPRQPAIIFAGYESAAQCAENQEGSDFEEDGERLLDLQVALTWYLRQFAGSVDQDRIAIVGFDVGGHMAALGTGMIDVIDLAVISGFSPEYRLTHSRAANHRCHEWFNGGFDVQGFFPPALQGQVPVLDSRLLTEFYDESDLYTLIAPRPLVLQTSATDTTFSNGPAPAFTPFSNAKHAALRGRSAYLGALTNNFVHTMFTPVTNSSRPHRFSVGLSNTGGTDGTPYGLPRFVQETPLTPLDMGWQLDPTTVQGPASTSLFSFIDACFAGVGCGHRDCCP